MAGLIRSVTESAGVLAGAALIYSISALFLCLLLGWPRIQRFPRRYLLIGSLLFVSYEICLALSLGFASDGRQAIEVSMINYLWPCFTLLFALWFNRQRPRWWLWPGLLLALGGVGWIISGDGGWSFGQMWRNIQLNPLSYGLAFAGAVIWALYCNLTRKLAQGHNGVTLFFILTALVLWLSYGLSPQAAMQINGRLSLELLLAGLAMGSAYACWNLAILRGNIMLLACASYFTPVLSTFFAALLLDIELTRLFWQGVAMVTAGSLLCWLATRGKAST